MNGDEQSAVPSKSQQIDTGGGSYVEGSVQVGGDFIGRDLITIGYTADEVAALIAEVRKTDQPITWNGNYPYIGLNSFREDDVQFFFGREKLVGELIERVKSACFVCIAGPSGSGKSSLAQAGLIYKLRGGALDGSRKWLFGTLTPQNNPIEQLAAAMGRLAKTPVAGEHIRAQWMQDATALHAQIETLLSEDKHQRCVLLVDQFEEVFTQTKDEVIRKAFVDLLTTAAQIEGGRTSIILALRSDFITQCARYPDLRLLMSQQFQLVGAMEPRELTLAIARPALNVGASIEPELVLQIIADMKNEPGALPLMQFALKDLFAAQLPKEGNAVSLTLKDYLDRGGIDQALERHANEVFTRLTDEQKILARNVFSRLIEVGRGAVDTRRIVPFAELAPAEADHRRVEDVVKLLADERLVTTSAQALTQEWMDAQKAGTISELADSTVTVAHEKLIDAWPWLRRLVDENRDAIILQNQTAEDALEWVDNGKHEDYLYRGAQLSELSNKLADGRLSLTELSNDFVEASRRRERRERAKRVAYIAGMAVLILLIALAGLLAFVGGRENKLKLAGQTAALAVTHQERQIDLAYLLSAESYQVCAGFDDCGSQDTLLSILGRHPYLNRILHGHSDKVLNVAFKPPDGDILASVDADGFIRLWRQDGQIGSKRWAPLGDPIDGGHDAIWDLAFSPDGDILATANKDATITLWSGLASGAPISQTLDGHTNDVYALAFSPDGELLASGSRDNTIVIWDLESVQSKTQLSTQPGHKHTRVGVTGLSFDPDGKFLASCGADGRIFLWDAAGWITATMETTHLPTGRVELENETLWSLAFTPDGKKLAAGTGTGEILVWETEKIISANEIESEPVHEMPGHRGLVYGLAFSQDGNRLASASKDGVIRLWDTSDWRPIVELTGHSGPVISVAFGPDFWPEGGLLASGGNDEHVILWDIPEFARHVPKGGDWVVTAAAASHEQKWVATGVQEEIVRADEVIVKNKILLRDGAHGDLSGDPILVTDTITHTITQLAFSPGGEILISGSKNGYIRVWYVVQRRPLTDALYGHTDAVSSMAFSPDGKWLVSGSCSQPGEEKKGEACKQGEIILWNTTTWSMVGEPVVAHGDVVASLAFSGSSKLLASGSCAGQDPTRFCDKGDIILWEVSGQGLAQVGGPLLGQNGLVESLAFSPHEDMLAAGSCGGGDTTTGCLNGEIRIWNVETKELNGPPIIAHLDAVVSLGFSPDSAFLVSAGADNSIIIWDMLTRRPVDLPNVGHSDRITSIAFNSDGGSFTSGSWDGTIKEWLVAKDGDPNTWLEMACLRAGRSLTPAEWDIYLPGEPYRETCQELLARK